MLSLIEGHRPITRLEALITVRQVVEAYKNMSEPERAMSRDTGSRLRAKGHTVELDGHRWPKKALFVLTLRAMGRISDEVGAAAFNTAEATRFFARLDPDVAL